MNKYILGLVLSSIAALILFTFIIDTSGVEDFDLTNTKRQINPIYQFESERESTIGGTGISSEDNNEECTYDTKALQGYLDKTLPNELNKLGDENQIAIIPLIKDFPIKDKYIQSKSSASASLIKLFVAGAVYSKVTKGQIKDSEIDKDMKAMLNVSDNNATNALIDKIGGIDEVNKWIQANGYKDTVLVNKLGPSNIKDKTKLNSTSAKDVATIMKKFQENKVNNAYDKKVIAYAQSSTKKISNAIFHKTGEFADLGLQHDAAVVKTDIGNISLTIMLKKNGAISNEAEYIEHIKKVSESIIKQFNSVKRECKKKTNSKTGTITASGWRKIILEKAVEQAGKPYVWGAMGPKSFDCSGFVNYVFNHANIGIKWPRCLTYDYEKSPDLIPIRWEDRQPGDICTTRKREHVVIVYSKDSFIHAGSTKLRVLIIKKGDGDYEYHLERLTQCYTLKNAK